MDGRERPESPRDPPFLVEFLGFLATRKRWWLAPLLLSLLLVAGAAVAVQLVPAPFLYTLF